MELPPDFTEEQVREWALANKVQIFSCTLGDYIDEAMPDDGV
jgi:hypothetical protein